MNGLLDSFGQLDAMQKVYWIIALASSVVFLIQAVMLFVGGDADTDFDGSVDADVNDSFDNAGFHLVSVKTIVCFLLGFGWTGVLFANAIANPVGLGILAAVVGLVFMALIAWLLWLVLKLDKDNTFHVEKTVGMTADVYLHIPAARSETGKVTVSYNGSMHELHAMTEQAEAIPTGAIVRITGVVEGETVLVEKI